MLICLNDDFSIEYIPVVVESETIRLANSVEKEKILDGFRKRSMDILQEGFVSNTFDELCDTAYENTLACISGQETVLFKILNKCLFGHLRRFKLKKKYNKEYLYYVENTLQCEPHYEVLMNIIKNEKKRK